MDRAKVMKTSIIMILLVALVVGYYSYLSSKNNKNARDNAQDKKVASEMTVVQQLIAKSDYKEYPSTPVQVVKYYNEITACYYNEKYSDSELEQLANLALTLCDDAFVNNQSRDQYISNLKKDIKTFKSGNITIYDTEVTSATDVEYFSHDGYECAKLYCVYTLKSGTSYQPSKEVFILRKDEGGHWKIFGFELVEE